MKYHFNRMWAENCFGERVYGRLYAYLCRDPFPLAFELASESAVIIYHQHWYITKKMKGRSQWSK